jgi:hypothetical protein
MYTWLVFPLIEFYFTSCKYYYRLEYGNETIWTLRMKFHLKKSIMLAFMTIFLKKWLYLAKYFCETDYTWFCISYDYYCNFAIVMQFTLTLDLV